jgi:hypothetical protein
MAETENIFSTQGPDGSFLGKYYCRLILADYERPLPFSPGSWDVSKGQTIFLPLPRELSDATSGRYNEESIEGIGDLINFDPAGLGFRIALEGAGPTLGAVAGAITKAAGGLGSIAAGAAEVGGVNSKNITSAIQSVTGKSPNPNPSVLFTGPDMRDINFSWAFYPKNYDEAEKVNEIIKKLKRAALPKPWAGYSSGVLSYPKLCQINFFPWDTGGNANSWGWTDKSIIRIKKCFLSSVSASYSDFGNPAFFHSQKESDTNYSVTYRLNVTFKEVEYILSRDWEDGVANFQDGTAIGQAVGNTINAGMNVITDAVSDIQKDFATLGNKQK